MGKHVDEARLKREDEMLRALRNFRQLISAAKLHFQAVQAECGLTGAQLWTLWEVSLEPGLKLKELARRLSVRQSTVSNLLSELQVKGLIVRERIGLDQRVVRVSSTRAGEDVLKKAPGPPRGVLAAAIGQLPDDKLQELTGILEALLHNVSLKDNTAAKRPLSDLLSLIMASLWAWAAEVYDWAEIAAMFLANAA